MVFEHMKTIGPSFNLFGPLLNPIISLIRGVSKVKSKLTFFLMHLES